MHMANLHPSAKPRPRAARPKNLRLVSIRLPLPALVSILHRVSGVLMFLALPALLFLLQASLSSSAGFDLAVEMLDHPLIKLPGMLLVWSFLHHFIAGLRHLSLDMRLGLELQTARFTAKCVLVSSLCLTLLIGMWLW